MTWRSAGGVPPPSCNGVFAERLLRRQRVDAEAHIGLRCCLDQMVTPGLNPAHLDCGEPRCYYWWMARAALTPRRFGGANQCLAGIIR